MSVPVVDAVRCCQEMPMGDEGGSALMGPITVLVVTDARHPRPVADRVFFSIVFCSCQVPGAQVVAVTTLGVVEQSFLLVTVHSLAGWGCNFKYIRYLLSIKKRVFTWENVKHIYSKKQKNKDNLQPVELR